MQRGATKRPRFRFTSFGPTLILLLGRAPCLVPAPQCSAVDSSPCKCHRHKFLTQLELAATKVSSSARPNETIPPRSGTLSTQVHAAEEVGKSLAHFPSARRKQPLNGRAGRLVVSKSSAKPREIH